MISKKILHLAQYLKELNSKEEGLSESEAVEYMDKVEELVDCILDEGEEKYLEYPDYDFTPHLPSNYGPEDDIPF